MTQKERIYQLIDEMDAEEAEEALRYLEEKLQTTMGINRRPIGSAYGKYAGVLTSSDDFMRRKHEEIAWEEERFTHRISGKG